MKKLIALGLTLVSITMLLAGCSADETSFTQKSYVADGTQVKKMKIDVRDRQIEISPSEDHQIHIKYAESEKEYYEISISEENVLSMTAVENKQWSDYIGSKPEAENRRIFLQIPNAQIAALEVSTTNADIQLTDLNVTEDLILSANGGNICVEKINAGSSIVLTGKNGDITGSVLGGYDDYAIMCTIKKGDSNLPAEKKGGAKTLSVNANNGDVEIEFYR